MASRALKNVTGRSGGAGSMKSRKRSGGTTGIKMGGMNVPRIPNANKSPTLGVPVVKTYNRSQPHQSSIFGRSEVGQHYLKKRFREGLEQAGGLEGLAKRVQRERQLSKAPRETTIFEERERRRGRVTSHEGQRTLRSILQRGRSR